MKNNSAKVLVVDDDASLRSLFKFRLENLGHQVNQCGSGEEVEVMLTAEFPYKLVLLDMMLPGIDGLETLKKIKHEHSQCQVIIVTGYPSVKKGVEAIKLGAYDFICKPFDIEQLLQLVGNALENQQLREENQVLRQTLIPASGFSDLIGQSKEMNRIRKMIRQSAGSRATVLITGSSGSGKEVVARTIHQNSMLHEGPFVAVNCGAIPDTLVESELFGYEKGAFTGAARQTKGHFEQAHNGTIFLDEIGELPLNAQVKLLRVLQEKEVVRLGGSSALKLNFRVVAATNRDLRTCVQQQTFREDLYYRLALFLIELPGLSERGGDVVLLANHFLEKYGNMEERSKLTLDSTGESFLREQKWPGNVRQLENCIHRSILMSPDKETLTADDIALLPAIEVAAPKEIHSLFGETIIPFKSIEARAIEEALVLTRGNVRAASQQLEISRVTLYRKIKEYQLQAYTNQQAPAEH